MGIELTDKELEQLMKTLPIDGKPRECTMPPRELDLMSQHEQLLIF